MGLNNLFILNVVNSGISLIMGFYMFFLHRNSFKLGTGYWASGSLIIGIGLLFKVFFPVESSLSIISSSISITIGLYLYLAGIWKFKGKTIYKWIIIGIPVLDFLQSIIFFNISQSDRIRIGLHLFFMIIYCFLAIYEMFRLNSAQKYLKKIFLLNAFSFINFLALLFLSGYDLIVNPKFNQFELTNAVILMHIISGLGMISLTFGFLSAVNIRLNMELESQIKSNTKFLSIIAHDLRGPVGNISSFLNLLQNETTLSEKQRKEYLGMLNTLSQSTFHLLQNLLEWATKSKNLNKFKSERIELSQILDGNIDIFKSSTVLKSIDFKYIKGEQTYMLGNANMLQTIFRNLVSNAIKFTPEGGAITITSEKTRNKVCLIVADTGQGIKSETIDSLFKFEINTSTVGTNGETGSGLGLVLCKELILRMNGVIDIESHIGSGTKVIVEFPAVA
ncbi:MAG: HAMP domain-containing sensor histidine kinase [Paludibacter sp.]|nr:HAMP domain-containing sensor histidine kinase [Paludibacter sp.]